MVVVAYSSSCTPAWPRCCRDSCGHFQTKNMKEQKTKHGRKGKMMRKESLLQWHLVCVWFQLLSLCEADDSQLLKLPCYKTVQSLTPLRKSALSKYSQPRLKIHPYGPAAKLITLLFIFFSGLAEWYSNLFGHVFVSQFLTSQIYCVFSRCPDRMSLHCSSERQDL